MDIIGRNYTSHMSVLGVKGSGWLCKFPRLINHNIVTLNIFGQCTKKCSGRVTTQGIIIGSFEIKLSIKVSKYQLNYNNNKKTNSTQLYSTLPPVTEKFAKIQYFSFL